MTPSGMRGVLNDALSLYFADAMLASAFVALWCVGSKVETAGGVFRVRDDEPATSGSPAAPDAKTNLDTGADDNSLTKQQARTHAMNLV
jgi:hypothetical protein